ncbi:hypothetical protein [Burkholderia sp. MBR-1]|uniref:hypothetical protein n=1 Tax=Burkholderia sp. MBR-1 TaxID=2732364 RepID=UPI0015EE45D6|nr:hypothetical protein [Burkholderia sp. MBR-1]QMI49821.1 hypothetical protein MBR110_30600 [Burkholderia sp. MBR-1]
MSIESGKLPEAAELAVEKLQVGDKVDLSSCPFLKERASADFEYAVVESVERETPECVAVSYQDHGVVGYPIGCKLKVSSETLADRKLPQVGPLLDYFIADNAAVPHVGICLDDEDRATLVSWNLPAGDEERSNLEQLVIGVVNAANDSGETTVSGLLTAGATHCGTRRVDGRMTHDQQSVYDCLVAAAVERRKLQEKTKPSYLDYVKGVPLQQALWWFIENGHDELEGRTDIFFALRERVRSEGLPEHAVVVPITVPALDPKFASEPTYTACMRVARMEEAVKAWNVADQSDKVCAQPDEHAVVCILADLRHYCDAHEMDFAQMDRHAYADYSEQKANDRHHENVRQVSSPSM